MQRGRRRRWPAQRWAGWAALTVCLTVLLATAPMWWSRPVAGLSWLAVAAVLALGCATAWLLRRLQRESHATAAALDQFAQRLREGDVSGALRAVRVDSSAPAQDSQALAASTGS